MKFLKYFFGANTAILVIALLTTTHFTSCIKSLSDTVSVHDTITITDTVTDTLCHFNEGLVAFYPFTNGSLADESGNGNDIVSNSAVVTSDRNGVSNNAYLFDGSTSFMRVANSTSLSPTHAISIVAVVKPNDFYRGTCHHNEILSKGSPDPVQGFYTMRITDPFGHCYDPADTTKEFFIGGYGDNIPQGASAGIAGDTSYVHAGNWYTAVYTYDGHESKIYVNGILVGIQQKTVPFTPNNQDLFIGRHEDDAYPYFFNGVIDEIRIYDRALCECEVTKIGSVIK